MNPSLSSPAAENRSGLSSVQRSTSAEPATPVATFPALHFDTLILKNRPVRLRGRSFIARVVSAKLQKTATVEREYRHYLPKYERYTMRKKKLHVHNPPELNVREGDTVRITECRPISKTKRFVIVEKVHEHESNTQ